MIVARCAGCHSEVPPEDRHYEVVNGVSKLWDSRCYAARAEYLNMTLASHEVRFGKKGSTPKRHLIYSPELNSFLDNEAADRAFEGLTEYEFLGDVGDK